jgi:GDP-L-fucose synthase
VKIIVIEADVCFGDGMELKGKRVVVTGGGGFLGRFVVDGLLKKRAEVLVPRSKEYDLRDREACKRAVKNADVVVHLAAVVGGIGANMENPGKFFYDNAIMGIQLINEAKNADVKKFVCIGTVCSYPKFTPVPFKESSVWSGYPEETNAPYGLAKKMLMVQLQAYRQQYGFNGIYLVPTNMYGPGDNFDPKSSHVIPAIIRKIDAAKANKTDVTLWGSGNASREFLYVEDAAEAIVAASEKYDKKDMVNLGNGMEIKIRELAELIADIMGYKGEIIWDSSKPDGQPRRCLDVSRAKAEFGWSAKTDIEEGLKKTIDWYMKNRKNL